MEELLQHVVLTLKPATAEADAPSDGLHPRLLAMLQEVAQWASHVTEGGKKHQVNIVVTL